MRRVEENVKELVDNLHYNQKVERSLGLLEEAYREFGNNLVVANSLGKDSAVVWHLAKRISSKIRGFIVTTRFKPAATRQFMKEEVERFPELQIFKNDQDIPDKLYKNDPDRCCELLKVEPTRKALKDLQADCWVTGLRCTEGRTRTDYLEIEERDEGLIKLNPILLWKEREIWQYLALNRVRVNPLYAEGYRSLGCAPCTEIVAGDNERGGRWIETSKCGGECGIHTKALIDDQILTNRTNWLRY